MPIGVEPEHKITQIRMLIGVGDSKTLIGVGDSKTLMGVGNSKTLIGVEDSKMLTGIGLEANSMGKPLVMRFVAEFLELWVNQRNRDVDTLRDFGFHEVHVEVFFQAV